MKNRLAIAAAMALAMPSIGDSVRVVPRRDPQGPFTNWLRANGRGAVSHKRIQRSVSTLQLRGWPETPCSAPDGYFWHRSQGEKRLYYLLKTPPGERHVEYDEKHDRAIIRSGWGYVKPTYAPGDVR